MFKVIRGANHSMATAVEVNSGRQFGDLADAGLSEADIAKKLAEVEQLKGHAKIEIVRLRNQAEQEIAEREKALELDCREQLEKSRAEGLAEGRKNGEQQVRQELQSQFSESIAKAEKLMATVQEQIAQLMYDNEQAMLQIAVAAAEKLLMSKVEQQDEELLLSSVRQAISLVAEQPQLVVRVNPLQYEQILAVRNDLQKQLGADRSLIINSDIAITIGGCMVDTGQGSVDATIDTRLSELQLTLQKLLQAV